MNSTWHFVLTSTISLLPSDVITVCTHLFSLPKAGFGQNHGVFSTVWSLESPGVEWMEIPSRWQAVFPKNDSVLGCVCTFRCDTAEEEGESKDLRKLKGHTPSGGHTDFGDTQCGLQLASWSKWRQDKPAYQLFIFFNYFPLIVLFLLLKLFLWRAY